MACSIKSINQTELQKVYSYVYGFTLKEMAENRPFTMDLIKEKALILYNRIASLMGDSPASRVSASNYASTVPSVVIDVINTYVDSATNKKTLLEFALANNFPWGDAYKLLGEIDRLEAKERISYIENWLGIGPSVAEEIISAQQTVTEIDNKAVENQSQISTPVPAPGNNIIIQSVNIKDKENVFAAVPPTTIKSGGNEKIYFQQKANPDPKVVFYYKVIRSLQKLVSSVAETDSRNIDTEVNSGIYIKFVSLAQARKMNLQESFIPGDTYYFAVPVTKTGELIYFDAETGAIVESAEKGKPIAFDVPRIDYIKKDNKYIFNKGSDSALWLENTVKSYATHNKVSLEEAYEAVQIDMAYNHAVQQKLKANEFDNTIIGYINGGSPGYILEDKDLRTTLESIVFSDDYQIQVDTSNSLKNGAAIGYLYSNELPDYPIRLWPPSISEMGDEQLIDTIATLYTTPIINKFTGKPITYKQRSALLETFIDKLSLETRGKLKMAYKTVESSEFTLLIDKKPVDISTKEGIDNAKQQIKTLIENGYTYNDKKYKVYLSINNTASLSKGYDPVKLKAGEGISMIWEPQSVSYYKFLEKAGVWINYALDDNNTLAKYNPYITFNLTVDKKAELAPYMKYAGTAKEPVKIEPVEVIKNLISKFKGKLVYATPGTGKTFAVAYNPNLVDMDDLLVEELSKLSGNTTFNVPYKNATNEEVGLFLESLFYSDSNKALELYDTVLSKVEKLKSDGKTILTGSHRFASKADYALINNNVEDISAVIYLKNKGLSSNTLNAVNNIIASQEAIAGKETTIDLEGKYVSDILFEKDVVATPVEPAYLKGNEKALKMLEELGEANFNKIMANYGDKFMTYSIPEVEGLIEDLKINGMDIKNNKLIDELIPDEKVTYKSIKAILAKQDAYGQSGIELFDKNYDYVGDITLAQLIDLIREDIAQVKPGLVYKGLQELPLSYDTPGSFVLPVPGIELSEDLFGTDKDFKLALQKRLEVKATPEQIKAAEEWYNTSPLKAYIPFQVIFSVINSNPEAIGQWTRNGIILTKNADWTDYYHEAFHGFIKTFMTVSQQRQLFNAAKNLPGTFVDYDGDTVSFSIATPKQLEEFLAEGFRNYMLNPVKNKPESKEIKGWFDWLKNVLRILFEDVTWDMLTQQSTDSSSYIYELYEKLRVGDLTGYSFQTENTEFNRVPTGMLSLDQNDPVTSINLKESDDIVNSIDVIISEYADIHVLIENKKLDIGTLRVFNNIKDRKYAGETVFTNDEEALWQSVNQTILSQRTQTNAFSIGSLKNKAMRKRFYGYVKARFTDKYNFYKQRFDLTTDPLAKKDFEKKLNRFAWVLRNYGNYESEDFRITTNEYGNVLGVVNYHLLHTDIFDKADKEAFLENIDVDEDALYEQIGENGRLFDEGGNSVSVLERADTDVIYLLNSLYETNEDTLKTHIPVINELGFPVKLPFDRVWNNIVRLLEDTDDKIDMYKVMQDEITVFPAYAQLLSKLGSPQIGKEIIAEKPGIQAVYEQAPAYNMKSFIMWNKFYQTFGNNFNSPLIQTTITETVDLDGANATVKSYKVTSGTASAVFKRVGERWDSEFSELRGNDPSIFVIRTEEDKNIIDIKKALENIKRDTLTAYSPRENFINFLNKIGINMSDTPQIIKALKYDRRYVNDILAIYDKLQSIYNYNAQNPNDKIYIGSISQLINVEREYNTGIRNLSSVYKNLQTLESRYSDLHSNFMVVNAEDQQQYEHTMHSTITRIVKILNNTKKYPKFQDVIALPKMRFLDPNKNYWTQASTLLNSLFVLQDENGNLLPTTDPKYGKRRERAGQPIQIEVNNLSGIALISNDEWVTGIANANSDTNSKLMSEIYNFINIQTFEVMRHSDKKYSFALGTDYVWSNNAFKNIYVALPEFITGVGLVNAANLIKKHLISELKRINKFKTLDTKGLEYDFKYLERGKNFIIFQDMPVDLKTKLLGLPSDTDFKSYIESDSELNGEIVKYITDWLTILSNNIDKALPVDALNYLPTNIPGANRQLLLQAFIANNVIHNLETLVIIYGDPAMYAVEKDEFHKRNSGAGGSGKISATDAYTLNVINSSFFDKDGYARKRLGGDNIQTRAYDATLDTAIIEDPLVKSAYYDMIADNKRKQLKKRNVPDEQINELLYGKDGTHDAPKDGSIMDKYNNMKTADAQGYMTFDAYRMLRMSQGRWSDIQDAYYKRVINGEKISADKLLEIFPPEKYQYWGHLVTREDLPSIIAMHKFAVMPLIPTVIKENTTLTQLHDKMMKEGIHYVTFKSGSKIGTISKNGILDKVYSDPQSMTIASDFQSKPFTKNTIFVDYLKIQVEIAPTFKSNISFTSQLRKLAEAGFMGDGGVPVDFRKELDKEAKIKAWNELTEKQKKAESSKYRDMLKYEEDLNQLSAFKKQELIDEIGITLNDDGTIKKGMENFIAYVKRELARKEIGNHTINMIGINEKGELKMPLDLSLEADTIEQILNNIITKKLVKFKIKGEGFIQVSNALFEDRDFALQPGRNFAKPTKEDLDKYGTYDLPYYRLDIVNGKEIVRLAKCKIAMTGDFYNLLYLNDKNGNPIAVYDTVIKDGKKSRKINISVSTAKLNALLKDEEWLDIGDHRRMVTISGPRIPVQGMNSAEAFEVYQFLPEEAGPILIPPAEIVAKSGSDFDKDTLYMMTPHIYVVNDKVKLMNPAVKITYTKDQINTKLKELRDKKSDLYDKLYKSKEALDYLKENLSPEETQAFETITDLYNTEKTEAKAKIAILQSTSIRYAKGKIRLTAAESINLENELYNAYVNLDIIEHTYKNNRKQYIGAFKEAQFDEINKEIEDLTAQRFALTSKAYENEIIMDYAKIISDPDNYDDLVTPNDTNIVKPLADHMAQFQSANDGRTWLFDKTGKGIAGTRILEIQFNLFKHEQNNVGKQVLGIGAVDNTYNILYNRIGMYMNPFTAENLDQKKAIALYEKARAGKPLSIAEQDLYNKAKIYPQTIYMKHNILNKYGYKAISLSDIYDAENKHKIGDVISQLINGWVDVAKDAWIFNLQGNKEISPTLLFMIQAGVPFEQAIYFVSQPLVKEYVEQQRRAKSAFGKPLGNAPIRPNMFRNQARAKILTDPKYGFTTAKGLDVSKIQNVFKQKFPILSFADSYILEALKEEPDNQFDFQKLKDAAENKTPIIDNHQRAAFLHFLQLEEMSKASTEFKMATNVDTSKTGTVYSVIDRLIKLYKLENNYRLPGAEMVKKLKEASPISSFFIQDFQLNVTEQLFPIRDGKSVIEFIKRHMGKIKDNLQDTYGEDNEEEFWQGFRNNIVSYIFQSALYEFDPRKITSYKGAMVSTEYKLAKVPALHQRVAIKEKDGKQVLYVDIQAIEQDFANGWYAQANSLRATTKAVPYAPLNYETFNEMSSFNYVPQSFEEDERRPVPIVISKELGSETEYRENQARKNQYVRFVIEREITRNQIPLSKAKDMYEYNMVLRRTPKDTENRELVAYEEFLKNRALDNIFNPFKMFVMPSYNMADILFQIKREFPDLVKQYPVLSALSYDKDKRSEKLSIVNIRLSNNKPKSKTIDIYKENLSHLANPNIQKAKDPETNAFISRFFAKLTFYGYMQAGLNAKGRFSLNKILPPEVFTEFTIKYIREYENYFDTKDANLSFYHLYYPAFVKAETTKGRRYIGGARIKMYGSPASFDYLVELDKRPADYVSNKEIVKKSLIPERERKDIKVFANEWGLLLFRPSKAVTMDDQIKQYNLMDSENRANNPDTSYVFVNNQMINPEYIGQLGAKKPGDWLMDHGLKSNVVNKMGIKTIKWDPSKKDIFVYQDDVVDGVKVVNKELKEAIDQSIARLLALPKETALIFNSEGYGREFLSSAHLTYLYLSEQLAKHFGYVNYAIKGSPRAIKTYEALESYYQAPITYAEAAELYQKCLS